MLKKSIGKNLSFEVGYTIDDESSFIDLFNAVLLEVNVEENYILVNHFYLISDDDFNEKIASQKRKLVKGDFRILDNLSA